MSVLSTDDSLSARLRVRRRFRQVAQATSVFCAIALAGGCGSSGKRDRFAHEDDASLAGDSDMPDIAGESMSPDTDPLLGGPCLDDEQCARPTVSCATFKCDKSVGRCRATPDDTRCDDGVYCNGAEHCDPRKGCVPGAVIDCNSGDTCSIDRCVEETHKCEHKPRDADDDGDPTSLCTGLGKDCDDRDPTVSSKATEICGNKKDDNCDGVVDESSCVSPAYNSCDTAFVIKTTGTYSIPLVATSRTISASCASTSEFLRQGVLAISVPAGSAQDIDIVATPLGGGRVALASSLLCGDSTGEIGCAAMTPTSGGSSARLKLRSQSPGVHPVYVFGQVEANVEIRVTLGAATSPATNLSCATATALFGTGKSTATFTTEVADMGSLPTVCTGAQGPLVYKVDIASSTAPMDLRVRASAASTSSGVRTILGLRDAGCLAASNELRCGYGTPADLFVRGLGAGTYYVTLGVSTPTDVTVEATLAPATTPPTNEVCTGAPTLPLDTTTLVDLKNHEDNIAATCLGGSVYYASPIAADGAYALKLAVDSDVLIVAHSTGTDSIGLALAAPACAATDLGCARGSPPRLVRRALKAGEYRVVVESANASTLSLSAFSRPAATPGGTGADNCAEAAIFMPPEGGLFVGSTSGKKADFDASCDSPTTPRGGAEDVIYRLDIAKKSRLIVDTSGSAFSTTVSIRTGGTCPGVEIPGACAAGYVVENAFLDVPVEAGTYWIVVDGYSLASGGYRLDVRVAPPAPALP